MSEFKPSSEVRAALSADIVGGAKVPHTTSQPLVRLYEGRPVLAAFAFLYSAQDMRTGLMPPPQLWLVADIKTGEVLGAYKSDETGFSMQPADSRFSIRWEPPASLDADYFKAAYALLDTVRLDYLNSGTLDKSAYAQYFDTVTAAVPPEYRVFYEELGSPDAL